MERKVACENFPSGGAKQQPSGYKWQPKFKSIKVTPKKIKNFYQVYLQKPRNSTDQNRGEPKASVLESLHIVWMMASSWLCSWDPLVFQSYII